ncbi:DUF2252 domain-containing protein [Microbacterium saperdae]|uniref:Uncharacterized protein (DUF2252 family) n=1 Tax=Microbacterium saperdae TaxID=69368 RepID=A0A543B9H4_9MICO|nr:DUF2252 domain-containing protein [Microbacterium saperdae]TQL81499.1 uncharacterized protein (DUF2252 family) [Microbacterium saperdae]GGM59915.1 hypothetical protein GCM10010489_34330 [Microbacterium saperdae]
MNSEWAAPASHRDLLDRGIAARKRTPRRALAELAGGTRDPLGILTAQNRDRIPELVPLRAERMAVSPFTFYRGTAALMAADLADAPHSGILVASCGDAHVSNFGFYASAERSLMFDLNDFDEAAWAPWEWDVKRLVASIVVGGQASGRADDVIDEAVRGAVAAYARGIARASELSPTARYFTHFSVASARGLLDKASQKVIRGAVKQAERRTGERAVRRLTEVDATARRRFVPQAPTTTPVGAEVHALVHDLVAQYRGTASADIALLFEHFTVSDIARRVVGVGSVGTRCYLVLFQDGEGNTLLMQPKQASRSVLEEYGRIVQPPALQEVIDASGEGARVTSMQRILQALSDPFLGHLRGPNADFYVRQFHDMKGSIDVEELEDGPFVTYAQACAATIARAHSQSVTASEVAGYIGSGRVVGQALLDWARAYAEVSLADYRAFLAASGTP